MASKLKGEDCISLSQVQELLKQQQDFYMQLLTQKESNFKGLFQNFVDSTNERMDDMIKEVQDLKISFQFSKKEVEDLKETCKELTIKCKDARTDINNVCESVLSMTGKADYLKGQSKGNNIIVEGIPESPHKSWEESEDKVREMLAVKQQMDEKRIELECAYRTGTNSGDRPRPKVVKFLRFKDKMAVLERGHKLKGTNIFLNEDYTVRQRSKELIPTMKAERGKRNIAYIQYDRLIVHPPSQKRERAKPMDSSQNDSLSDQEDHRPGFSMPSISSFDDQDTDATEASSNFTMYNSVSQKLMAKMGFREGEGLGKFGQGRKEIVEASTQRGRRGLGLTLQGFQGELNVDWRDEPEPSAIEKVDWFPECTTEIPDADELRDWMILGQRKLKIEDETEFCTEDLLHTLLRCKTVFDSLEGEEMRRARTRSNPYETIRGGIFLNRAAMKMANIDHCFDNMFTNPKDSQGKPLTKDREGELLYFGDVCAGPGGFSEYILWKRNWHAKGFGMTLKGPCDFKLEDFYAAPSELFEPYYGEGGVDGDGDITRPENVTAFRNFVLESTEKRGLHFLMADGGFSVEGQENIQEILSKQLLLCQFLTAMSTLRPGGHFVCKTFDLFTPFSVGLVYLLYLCFDRISLFKPVTSRPANSERYIVCRGLKPGSDAVREYMFRINLKLNQLRNTDTDVTDVVPLSIIKEDTDFYQFMVNSNESLCAVQIKALAKIHAYVVDPTLAEPRQADIRKECLKLWAVPDKARVTPASSDPKSKFYELIKNSDVESFQCKLTPLNSTTLEKLRHILDHRCIVGGGEQIFLLALGKSQIYTWDGKMPVRWKKLENFKLELPRDTLLSVEIIQELKGEGKAQRRINAVHVMDVLILNGTDVRDKHFNQRIQMAEKFVKAVAKPSRPDMNPIRVKEVYRLEEMEKIFVRLEMKVTKSSGGVPRLSYTGRDDRHFLPKGLYIIKTVNEPWTMAYSKNSKMKFFFNKTTKQSTYEMPPNSAAPFHVCHSERLFWAWEDGVIVHDSQTRMDPEKLSKDYVLSFVHQHYQP